MDPKTKLVKPTTYFLFTGLVIGGFTALALIGIHQGIQFLIQNCESAWYIYILLTIIGSVVTPLFYWRKLNSANGIRIIDIWIFNLLQYTFLQGALTVFWTSADAFCNVTDGQNGLEYVFSAWTSLPVIFLLNLAFEQILKHKTI